MKMNEMKPRTHTSIPIPTPESSQARVGTVPALKFPLLSHQNRLLHPTLAGGNPSWKMEKSQVNQTRKLTELTTACLCLETVEAAMGAVVPGSFKGSVWKGESAQIFQQVSLVYYCFPGQPSLKSTRRYLHNVQPLGESGQRRRESLCTNFVTSSESIITSK